MNPHRKSRTPAAPAGGLSRPVQGGLTVAGCVIAPLVAVGGGDGLRAALDFTTGVLSLVSLTASVAWGLVAGDRLLLSPRQRLLAQAVHRVTATAALGLLLLHATVKVSLGHVGAVGALIPFGLGTTGTAGLIGFGSLAGLLMVVAGATGALRSALAGHSRAAGRWRALHMLAYPAWCFALMHGLFAGRPADTWVVTLYCLALLGVSAALSLRLLPRPVRRRIADRVTAAFGQGGGLRTGNAAVRDSVVSLLPGAAESARAGGATDPATLADPSRSADPLWIDRLGGAPPWPRPGAGPPPSAPLETAREQPRLSAPAPRLYEAPPPSHATAGRSSAPGGTGMWAAYRAVSRAGAPSPAVPPGEAPTERIPVAGDIPAVRRRTDRETTERRADREAAAERQTVPGTQVRPAPSPQPPYRAPSATTDGPVPFGDRTAPGPLFPPPAQEPWDTTAGERQ
ncbi:hypothetical protein [Streptomyces yaizuensis]|uniref:Membrane protein n=1 Tax=Streptomyces yaizuensis TaxID=2989713 RepID=A0ABQ5NTT3_9ACTN|nr:hypothetical protein [Streptomyces sp. YSPA8]GLF93752.1 membrane protein [Streptomyces sp. YSPA8]